MSSPKKKQTDHDYYLKHKEKIIKHSTEWNARNRSYHREYDRRWRAKYPHKRKEAHLKRAYNITLDEIEILKSQQDGRCSICLEQVARLVVDHCHKTNKIRSLLCTTCNAGLGQFKDSVVLLARAIEYLNRHDSTSITKKNN